MSELRKNMLTGEWVVYAVERENRPYDFVRSLAPKNQNTDNCPFCGGHEDQTPWPIIQEGENGIWKLRVFENRYPVVSNEEEGTDKDAFYDSMQGLGRHEVLVDTPNHQQTIDQFTQAHLADILNTLKERGSVILTEPSTNYLQIFKNCGADAGMSLAHSHWQMVGLPMIPRRISVWKDKSEIYQNKHNSCMLCDMLSHEKKQKKRFVFENQDFAVFTPYAGRFAYEVYILPKVHISNLADLNAENMDMLAQAMLFVIKRLCQLRQDIGFNICFLEEPKCENKGLLHWHVQIYPRVGGFAGIEFATETYINSVLPEKAAAFYRGEKP